MCKWCPYLRCRVDAHLPYRALSFDRILPSSLSFPVLILEVYIASRVNKIPLCVFKLQASSQANRRRRKTNNTGAKKHKNKSYAWYSPERSYGDKVWIGRKSGQATGWKWAKFSGHFRDLLCKEYPQISPKIPPKLCLVAEYQNSISVRFWGLGEPNKDTNLLNFKSFPTEVCASRHGPCMCLNRAPSSEKVLVLAGISP